MSGLDAELGGLHATKSYRQQQIAMEAEIQS